MYSDVSERMLLGLSFNEGRNPLTGALVALLSHEDFFNPQHANTWRCVTQLHELNLPTDAAAVLDRARQLNLFLGGVEYITGIIEDPTVVAGISDEAAISAANRVKSFATRRRLREALLRNLELCNTSDLPVEDIMTSVEDDVSDLRKRTESGNTGPVHVAEVLDTVLQRIDLQMAGEVPPPCPTGYEDVDAIIHGLEDEQLIILAGRPSMGKTALMLNYARNNAEQGRTVLVFSLEMAKTQLAVRLLGLESRVDGDSLRRATVSNDLHKLQAMPFYIDDTPGLTLHDIRARARAFVERLGKCVIYVDYLQYIASPPKTFGSGEKDSKDPTGAISRGLKMLARELKCPVVALAQLSRALEQRANKRPMMSDLRESGQIEQDADVIMFIYRDEYYNPDTKEPGVTEVIVGKQRDGAVGTAKLGFENRIGKFQNMTF